MHQLWDKNSVRLETHNYEIVKMIQEKNAKSKLRQNLKEIIIIVNHDNYNFLS